MQAERFREILTNLGPAFVKIGQVSTCCDRCSSRICHHFLAAHHLTTFFSD